MAEGAPSTTSTNALADIDLRVMFGAACDPALGSENTYWKLFPSLLVFVASCFLNVKSFRLQPTAGCVCHQDPASVATGSDMDVGRELGHQT